MYTALIRSKIDYGSEFYHNTTQQCKNKLDLIQYKCLRVCSGALRSTPIPIFLITNKEIPLETRWKEVHAKFLYKIYNKDVFKNLLAKLLYKSKSKEGNSCKCNI